MRVLTRKAPAKINFAIDVLSRRPDGYHEVAMVMQTIDLHDTITVKESFEQEVIVTASNSKIPTGKENIVYKAADYMRIKYNVKMGASIHIEKNIPVAAGLAGGSTDAAATILLLDELWRLKLTRAEKMEIGKKIGADVPFCIMGGTALAEGIGEKLTTLTPSPTCHILLAKPNMSISTKEVYEGIVFDEIKDRPNIKAMIEGLGKKELSIITSNMVNVLETVTLKKCPQVKLLKETMMKGGAMAAMMSGSGPTVFGVFENQKDALQAYAQLHTIVEEVFLVKTI